MIKLLSGIILQRVFRNIAEHTTNLRDLLEIVPCSIPIGLKYNVTWPHLMYSIGVYLEKRLPSTS
jgi:hypothetical protein